MPWTEVCRHRKAEHNPHCCLSRVMGSARHTSVTLNTIKILLFLQYTVKILSLNVIQQQNSCLISVVPQFSPVMWKYTYILLKTNTYNSDYYCLKPKVIYYSRLLIPLPHSSTLQETCIAVSHTKICFLHKKE